MKIKVTHPIVTQETIILAGTIIDVPDKQAKEYIEKQWAFEYKDKGFFNKKKAVKDDSR